MRAAASAPTKPLVATTARRRRVRATPTAWSSPSTRAVRSGGTDAVGSIGLRADVRVVLSPAWSTDWITAEGRTALSDAGIAPPARVQGGPVSVELGSPRARADQPACPQCGSRSVEELARFGSTACKALWRCLSCREPFDYVKPL